MENVEPRKKNGFTCFAALCKRKKNTHLAAEKKPRVFYILLLSYVTTHSKLTHVHSVSAQAWVAYIRWTPDCYFFFFTSDNGLLDIPPARVENM